MNSAGSVEERGVTKALAYLLEYVDGQRVAEGFLPKHAYESLFDSFEEAYRFLLSEGLVEYSSCDVGVANRTVADCKALLQERGLPLSGSKPVLVARILSSFPSDELEEFSQQGLLYQITPRAYSVLPDLEADIKRIRDLRSSWWEEEKRLRLKQIKASLPKLVRVWRNEEELFSVVQALFPDDEVVHHYRADWLGRLELDVYAVGANVGFEYQGIQHYEPQEHWGGVEAFVRARERDAEKKRRCAEHGTRLVEVRYDEDVTEEVVRQKLGGGSDACL